MRRKFCLELTEWNSSQIPSPEVGSAEANDTHPLLPSRVRPVEAKDTHPLAELILAAYRGTVDDEGEGPPEALAAIQGFFEEDPGPPILSCSYVIDRNGTLFSACLISLWKQNPIITAIMTHPEHKRQGLGLRVLLTCLHALQHQQYSSVLAFITNGNLPSEKLFAHIGFQEQMHQQ